MFTLKLIFLIFNLTSIHNLFASSSTHKNKPFYTDYLSTKTPYRFIENTEDSEISFQGCNVTKLWAVLRHGTRTPGTDTTDLIKQRLPYIRDLIVNAQKNQDCDGLKKWTIHPELDDKKRLTHSGEDEMINLGERFGNRFSKILPEDWYNSTYTFRYTDTERTKSSAKYFTTGLFGKRVSNHVWFPPPLKKDPILRFYKLCEKWRQQIKKNPQTYYEVEKFLKDDIAKKVVNSVTKRLGLKDGSLDISDIQLIYTTCCFETAWDQYKKSPWCDVLTMDEFKIMEYAEDLEYYWIDGYGHELTTQIACPMLQDAINHLKADDDRLAVFYFTHSGTILKFLSHLGLYKDPTPLLHNTYEKNKNRAWKTSKIDVFASNIALIRYDCIDGPKLLTMHQEKPVRLPGCPVNEDLCALEKIEQIYRKSLQSCDFIDMCSTNESFYRQLVRKLWNFFR